MTNNISPSKRYNNIKLGLSVGKSIASFILVLMFITTGLSKLFTQYLFTSFSNDYLVLIIYTAGISLVSGLLFFPVNFYSEYLLEHKYGLSNQTVLKWFVEGLKGLLLTLVIGVPVLLFFYWVISTYPEQWWFIFALFLFLLSVVLARILPVLILPLFYKITPIENEELKNRINNLAKNSGMKVENIYKFDMSKNTKKANAAFTGLGKSKRIILGDTLLDDYSIDEIETVLAHEFGHYKEKHIIKLVGIGTVNSFLTLFLISSIYKILLPYFGFTKVNDIAALPLLVLLSMVISLILNPINSGISRKFEYSADRYAVNSTGKKEDFIRTLNKLTDQNLGDKEPHPIVEWFFYSHPSIKNRISAIEKL